MVDLRSLWALPNIGLIFQIGPLFWPATSNLSVPVWPGKSHFSRPWVLISLHSATSSTEYFWWLSLVQWIRSDEWHWPSWVPHGPFPFSSNISAVLLETCYLRPTIPLVGRKLIYMKPPDLLDDPVISVLLLSPGSLLPVWELKEWRVCTFRASKFHLFVFPIYLIRKLVQREWSADSSALHPRSLTWLLLHV